MESKKINQLATELTPALSDLTIIGDPTTGISKKITLSQMASLFTGTVEEYANVAAFPLVGVADTIYIALDTNVLYRWDTGLTSYVELSPNIINSLVFSDANGFDGNISLVGSVATLTITTALTTGSVPFIGASGALSQDNANLFFDDTNNRLGINTNAPTTALDVFGSGIIGRINGTSTNNAFLGFASAGTNKWSIGNVQSDHRFRIYNEATTSELISVLSTGEFGIGIANPTTKFHIDGAASALIANLDANVSVAKTLSFRSDNSNRINLEVSGTESGSNAGANLFIRAYSDAGSLINTLLTITRSTGNLVFNSIDANGWFAGFSNSGTNIGYIGATAQFATTGGTATDIGIRSGNDFAIYTGGGTERMRITTTGNVGINVAAPIAPLHIYSLNQNVASNLSTSYSNGKFRLEPYNTSGIGISMGMISPNVNYLQSVYSSGTSAPFVIQPYGGNVGINTDSPSYTLSFNGDVATTIGMNQGTLGTQVPLTLKGSDGPNGTNNEGGPIYISSGLGTGNANTSNIIFSTSAIGSSGSTRQTLTERMRINGSGNVGIGTSSPTGKLMLYQNTSGNVFQNIVSSNGGSTQVGINLSPSMADNEVATNPAQASIYATDSNYGANIIFANKSVGAVGNSLTERMRITSGGDVFVGFSGSAPGQRLRTQGADSGNVNYSLVVANSTTASTFLVRNDGLIQTGTQSGSPYNNTSGAAANLVVNSAGTLERSTSSLKYKKDVKDYDKGLTEVMAMRPVYYKGISESDGDKQFAGLIAEEIDALGLNEFVTYAEDGSPDALAYQNMIALLTKAIQEQQAQIEELKALIAAK